MPMQPPGGGFWAILAVGAAAWVGVTLLSVASGYLFEASAKNRRVWAIPLRPGQLRQELLGNAMFLGCAILVTAVVFEFDIIRFAAPESATWLRAAGTFLAMSVGFQAFYYAAHRLMHRRFFVRFHRWHHDSRVTTPWTGQSMSAVEAMVWMVGYFGLPALLSLFVPLSFGGWLAYMVYNVFGNLVGHVNAEAVAPHPGLWQRSTVATVFTFHALHHARWNGHYGFASTWADRVFRTEWRDWPDLHQKVWKGEALTSLKVRGEGYASAGAAPVGHVPESVTHEEA